MPATNRDDLRRRVHDQVDRKAATTEDMAQLKEKVASFVNSTFDNPDLRGVSQEKRHQAFTAQLNQLAEERNLPPGQKESLRQEFLKLEAERTAQRTAAINKKISELGRRDNEHLFEQEQMKERITKAYTELREVAGHSTPQAEWQEITARFDRIRENERRALMMKEIESLGKNSVELGSSPNASVVKQRLIEIRKKYADIGVGNPEELVSTFKSAYEREYDSKISQKGFIDRKYYQAKRYLNDCGTWLSAGLESLSSVGESFKSTMSEIGSAVAGGAKLTKDLVVWGAEKTQSAVVATAAFTKTVVTDPARAVEHAKAAVSQATAAVAAGAAWVADKAIAGGTAVVHGLAHVGSKSLELGALALKGDFRAAGAMLAAGAGASLSFAKGMCDSLGISQMATGLSHVVMAQVDLYRDLYKVATGQGTLKDLTNNYMNHIGGALQGIKGAAVCLGEVTGVTDLCLAGKHSFQALSAYGRGDTSAALVHLGQASVHGAFAAMSAGSIAATVATGGAAAGSIAAVALGRATLQQASKQVLKAAAKEFLEAGAKQIGQAAIKSMGVEAVQLVEREMGRAAVDGLRETAIKQLGAGATAEAQQVLVEKLALEAVLKREGAAIALEGAEGLAKQVSEQGAQVLAKDNVETVMRTIAETRTSDLLSKLKLSDTVQDLTLKMLKDVSEKKTGAVAKELAENLGIAQKEATKMAKEMKKALSLGKSDEAMKQILEDGITAQVKEVVELNTKESFQTTFKRALTGEVDETWAKTLREGVEREAKRLGKSVDSHVDELVEAGWKGTREGIEKSTRSAVREGVDKAFKEFRKGHHRLHMGPKDGGLIASPHEHTVAEGTLTEKPLLRAFNPEKHTGSGEKASSKTVMRDLGGGQYERVNMVYDPSAESWRVESSETISSLSKDNKAA
jgi:hypothetical protein